MTDRLLHAVRGILFDLDGTLIDSNFFHTVCWWQAFRQHELDVPTAVIHRSVGMGADQLIPHVLSEAGLADEPDADMLTAAHAALYAAYWPRLRTLPGSRQLLRRCHEAGLTTVLASSAGEAELTVLTRLLDCDDAVDVTTSSADAGASKPAPDIVQVALDKAGLAAQDCLFVGDAVWDVQAAGRAGVSCIGLESGGTSAAELLEAGAFATYRDAQDLLHHSEEWLNT
ncbi:MAG TPA: HAD family hydrolase [Jatrophihabitans sp.]|nr:HAD family hydrolase [Jatrophihabitans sp.]